MAQTIIDRVQGEIDSFNSLQEYHNRKMRLKYEPNYVRGGLQGVLMMGSEAQFEVGAYQAELAQGSAAALVVARAFRILLCAEFDE